MRGFHLDLRSVTDQAADAYTSNITRTCAGFNVESIGERVVVGSEDSYVVTSPGSADGMSTYHIVESDGTWLLQLHRFTEARWLLRRYQTRTEGRCFRNGPRGRAERI